MENCTTIMYSYADISPNIRLLDKKSLKHTILSPIPLFPCRLWATIAISYLTFAIFQIMTLSAVLYPNEFLNKNYFIYWLLGPGIFFIVEKYVFFRIDEKKYGYYSNYFLFAIGLVLLAKNLL